jgi:hypothetical protein
MTALISDLIQEQIESNKEQIALNNEIIKMNEKIIAEQKGVRGVLLSEYNERLAEAQKKYNEFQEKRDGLLLEFANENRVALEELQSEKDMIVDIHRELMAMHDNNVKLKQKVDKQLTEKNDLEKRCITLDTEIIRLRSHHAKLFNEAEIYRKQIRKLDEFIGIQNRLRLRIDADNELSGLIIQCVKEIQYEIEGESRVLCREA